MQPPPKQRNNHKWFFTRVALLLLLCAEASIVHASATNGTIDSVHKYAWSNAGGYVNFAPTNGGLTITDTALSGYAWSTNDGWINLSPSQGGVKNDGAGNLSGFAWDSTLGWVSFTGVTIDSSGKFHGQAVGTNETMSFDCANCDVETDWRPVSVRIVPSSGGSGVWPTTTSTTTPPNTLPHSVPPPVSQPGGPVIPGAPAISGSNAPSSTSSSGYPFKPTSSIGAHNTPSPLATTPTRGTYFDFFKEFWIPVGILLILLLVVLVVARYRREAA